MNNKVSLNVSFEGRKPVKIEVYNNITVAQFQKRIKRELDTDEDIQCVYFKGRKLDSTELLLNYIENNLTDVYLAMKSLEQKEEDFKQKYDEYHSDYNSKYDSKFRIFTTATVKSFLHGDIVDLKLSYNYDEIL